MRPIKSGNGGAACSLSIQVWLDVCVFAASFSRHIWLCFRLHCRRSLCVCVCVWGCVRVLWLRVCVWASESTYGLLLCGSLQQCAMFFVSVFVFVVFCNSEVAKYPGFLTCFYLFLWQQNQPTVSKKKTNSNYNSMIIIYHKIVLLTKFGRSMSDT